MTPITFRLNFLLISLLLTVPFVQSFCTHDEDCLEAQCCVQHVCVDCNNLSNNLRVKRTIEIPNNANKIVRRKRTPNGCQGCLGICVCLGDVCACIPVHDD